MRGSSCIHLVRSERRREGTKKIRQDLEGTRGDK